MSAALGDPGAHGADPAPATRAALAERFLRFEREAAAHASPLYARLARIVAADARLLDLAAHVPRESVPNLLLAAVQDVCLRDPSEPLARFYPSLGGAPPPETEPDALAAAFADVCGRRRAEILDLVRARRVQTNEIGRAACLLPALAVAQELGGGRPLALVEVGASAGLNLQLDRYAYDFGAGRRVGDPGSPVRIACELRGEAVPPIPAAPPPISSRIGIDLHPLDLRDPDDRRWLRALVWPDDVVRASRLEAAIALALEGPGPPAILAGDAVDRLPEAIAASDRDATLCVVHTSVLYQLAPEQRDRLAALLRAASSARRVTRVSAEEYVLRLATYAGGALEEDRRLGDVDGHGRWLRWTG